jgi:hypothetical protein
MAMIHINRSGNSLGTFSEEDVREGLRTGRFIGTDLAWREGMAAWQSLSQLPEFGGTPPETTPPQPAAPPVVTTPPAAAPITATPSSRSGLPWEDRQGQAFIGPFVETLQMVLGRPAEAFTVMKTEGGFGEPLIYALIGGIAGGLVSFLFSLGFRSFGSFAGGDNGMNALAGLGITSIGFVILLPLLLVLGLFIGAAIVHLCLMLVGGARKPFETTFRVLAFSHGSTGPLQMIPMCGGPIAVIWALIVNCIGIARAHEIDTGRAVLAVLLPFLVCCAGFFLLLFLGGLGAMSHNWH